MDQNPYQPPQVLHSFDAEKAQYEDRGPQDEPSISGIIVVFFLVFLGIVVGMFFFAML